jgi:hypothetical protein
VTVRTDSTLIGYNSDVICNVHLWEGEIFIIARGGGKEEGGGGSGKIKPVHLHFKI